jgi:hypothetical protein
MRRDSHGKGRQEGVEYLRRQERKKMLIAGAWFLAATIVALLVVTMITPGSQHASPGEVGAGLPAARR